QRQTDECRNPTPFVE
ncbi:tat (twin-arginine translocation) pathway signal sequence domain protein, partial [Vibrio parahaemolyticus V-223/04]